MFEMSDSDSAASINEILRRHGINADRLLAKGGESEIYQLDHQRVLRIPRRSFPGMAADTERRAAFYDGLPIHGDIAFPRILDIHSLHGHVYTEETLIQGINLDTRLTTQPTRDHTGVITRFVEAADVLSSALP